MLFGLFAKKSPVEVKVRREVNFGIDYRLSEKEIANQLKDILFSIEYKAQEEYNTDIKLEVKRSYESYLGARVNGKNCKSLVICVDFTTMTNKKEDAYDCKNRINGILNDIDENTRKFNIEYMN